MSRVLIKIPHYYGTSVCRAAYTTFRVLLTILALAPDSLSAKSSLTVNTMSLSCMIRHEA